MGRRLFFLLFFLAVVVLAIGQLPGDSTPIRVDTTAGRDSLPPPDSMHSTSVTLVVDSILAGRPSFGYDASLSWRILEKHPYFGFNGKKTTRIGPDQRRPEGKEWLFYLVILIFLIFASLQRAFPKYFSDLFRLFFRTTLKQRQIREQLMQTPLPSILLNCFYVISAGLYASFLLQYFKIEATGNFWLNYVYCCALLGGIYFVKFISLRFTGWLFAVPDAASAYIFVVFIINKMIGILLLPFILLLAFSEGNVYLAAMALSWCLVGGLLAYRFILTYGALRNQIRLNIFHFLLYLAAFEIAPLLLIYKVLISFFVQTS